MNKARIGSLEKIFGIFKEPWKGTVRLAPYFDDEPIPAPSGPDEQLVLLHVIRTPRHPHPPDGGGTITDEGLAAEVERLERERDELKAQR